MRPLILLVVLLLSACAGVAPPGQPTATVSGTVVAAPCRPVERPGDPPCPPVAGVKVDFGSASATTDGAGTYRVSLPPGTYRVAVVAGPMTRPAQPASVTVGAGENVRLDLTYDSGIR